MKKIVYIVFLVFCLLFFVNIAKSYSASGQSTEITSDQQYKLDEDLLSKPYDQLTKEEKKQYDELKKAQEIKRSQYEKRAKKHLANEQPETFDDYLKQAQDFKSQDIMDVNPKFEVDKRFDYLPEPEFQVVRYNYPAGSRELNLSILKTNRYAKSQGVLSPDGKYVVYTEVNYETGRRKASSSAYLIPVPTQEYKTAKKVEYLHKKEDELFALKEQIEKDKKQLSKEQKKKIEEKIKKLETEIKLVKMSNTKEETFNETATEAQRMGKALLTTHIKDRIKEPILSVGLFENDYGVQKTLTVVDWSIDGKKILFKEKISMEGNGLLQTNIWVYDMETQEARKLDEVRQAIEYYWKKDRMLDLYYYRYDLYPLGWDAKHSNRVLLFAYAYTKDVNSSPKFLGTWSIDAKGEQSMLISPTKTGYLLQANGFCLKARNLEYYERNK